VHKVRVISFVNPKGGAGKTTAALILATRLADQGARVSVIDADPEHWIAQWQAASGDRCKLTVRADATEESILDVIEAETAKSAFVIIDLEGTASLLVAQAIAASDLVIVPCQPSALDAKGAAKAVKLIAMQSRVARRKIAHSVLFTRTSAAVQSRSLTNIRQQLDAAAVPVMHTALVERAAFRDLLDYGGSLPDLPSAKADQIAKAVANGDQFAAEVIEILRTDQ